MRIFFLLFVTVAFLAIGCQNSASEKTTEFEKEEAIIEVSEAPSNQEKMMPEGMVLIPGGMLDMGGDNDQADPDEYPKHQTQISSFLMDKTEVTNEQFAAFVKATNYVTVAERDIDWEEIKKQLPPGTPKPPDSQLKAGSLVFKATEQAVPLDNPARWWQWVTGASWKNPQGPGSDLKDKMDHPVVPYCLGRC